MSDTSTRSSRTVRGLVFGIAALALVGLGLYGLGQAFQLGSGSEETLRSRHGSTVLVATAVGLVVLVVGRIVLGRTDGTSLAPVVVVALVAVAIPGVAALRAQRATGPDPTTSREMERFEPPDGLRDPRTQDDPAEQSMERVWRADRPIGDVCKDVAVALTRWAEKPGTLRTVPDGTGDCEYRAIHGERLGVAWVGMAGLKADEYVIVNVTIRPCEQRTADGKVFGRLNMCDELSGT